MKAWQYAALGLAAIWLAVGVYVLKRQEAMKELSEIAMSPLSSRDSARAAITELGKYRGSSSSRLLLGVATADREYLDGRQEVAIRELAARADAETVHRLAALLQPFWGLSRREAVAAALEQNPCDSICIAAILHYLERYWCGLGRWEDIPSANSGEAYAELEREQNRLEDRLDGVLRANRESTVHVLRDVYGLGSSQPGAFSLHIVETLGLREACPLLERSRHRLLDSSKAEKLQNLQRDLHCQTEFSATP